MKIIALLKAQFVLSGFALHLASHFARSFSIHSYCYGFSNDQALDRSPGVAEHMDVRERPLDRSPGVAEHMDVRERPLDRSPGVAEHMDVRERPLDRSPGVAEHMDVRERPNCFASYSANSGSFMQYAG